jgi:hypothetical protein
MAKTLSEELLALLDADTQAKVKAALASKPDLMVRDLKGKELLDLYDGVAADDTTTTTTTTATHTPTLPSSATTTAAGTTTVASGSTTSTTGAAGELAVVLARLEALKSDFATTIDAKLKDYIPASKLDEYRTSLLTSAIKSADDYASVRESHRAEFNEPLDRTAFEKFVVDQKAANVGYPSMSAAHDAFVKDKRVTAAAAAEKAKIEAAVAEALKQARSSGSVPGQTQSIAMSPAQQVIAKAKAAGNGNTASNAEKVAQQLEALERNRASVQ